MMAARRSLQMTWKMRNGRKRLVVATGSLVAFSASFTASAFLIDASLGETSAEWPTWSPLLQSKTRDHLLSIKRPWRLSPSTDVTPTKLFAKNDENVGREVTLKAEKIEIADTISETLRNRFQVGDSYVWLYQDVDGEPTSWEKYTIKCIEENNPLHEIPEFIVTIEMSTKFKEEESYQTHHRIKANLVEHFLESCECHSDWRIDFEYFLSEKNSWKTFGVGDNVQAFEEKFDVFSMVAAAERAENLLEATTKGGVGDYTNDPRDEYLVPWTIAKATCCESAESSPITRSALLSVNPRRDRKHRKGAESTCTSQLTQTTRHRYTEAWYGPSNHGTLSGIALYKEFSNSKHSFSLIERTRRRGDSPVTDVIEVIV